ncbi:CYTH domain-containing protein [Lachnospiraceae bacterium 62-35]
MEIERKYLISSFPEHLEIFPWRLIQQGYLSVSPVVRVRRDGDDFYLTYKSKGLMIREEYNLPLTGDSYEHLLSKADGNILTKKRYCIPLSNGLTAELDIFHGLFKGLALVEVEFPDENQANHFQPPEWFGKEVTFSGEYQNSRLSSMGEDEAKKIIKNGNFL